MNIKLRRLKKSLYKRVESGDDKIIHFARTSPGATRIERQYCVEYGVLEMLVNAVHFRTFLRRMW